MARLIHPVITSVAVHWLARHAPSAVPPELTGDALSRSTGVPVETQRQVLEAVALHGGRRAVALLADALRDVRGQPLFYILLNSSSVGDLIDKEQRLNQFLHSHHRVRIHELTARTLELEHYSRYGRRPVAAESLFVFGAHRVLLEEIGCRALRGRLPASIEPDRWVVSDGRIDGEPPDGDASRWHFEWERFEPARQVLVGLDELLLAQAEPADLSADRSAAEDVEQIIRQDLAHRWSLAEVARLCGRAPRSLQRALSAEDTSFSSVLDHVRVAEAARQLRDPALSVTEIGYTCGFADSAHFSRRFKALMGEPPSVWRERTSD